jgi:hypothetical protein
MGTIALQLTYLSTDSRRCKATSERGSQEASVITGSPALQDCVNGSGSLCVRARPRPLP